MNYLLDTNVISETVRPQAYQLVLNFLSSIPNESLFISVLTIGEIKRGIEKLPSSIKKEKLKLWLEKDLYSWFDQRILPINIQIVEKWGVITAERKLPAIDSLIAATCLTFNLTLVTRNIKDFAEIQGISIINPFDVSFEKELIQG